LAGKTKDPGFNDRMKQDRLIRQATRAHEWRVQVWAQSERKIQQVNAELKAMGKPEYEPWDADFTSAERLEHYSDMTITK
jgi:hypothetical protein